MAKLLIVDDESDIREFARNFFKKRKIDVFVASGGRQALDLIANENPNLILLDIRMEEMTGIEVLRELRKSNPAVKVIMVSGVEDEETIKEANALGVIGYIHKPFILEELEKIVLAQLITDMTSTKIDYKRELESASKGMILIHDPRLLIKLIVRSLVQKVHIQHAGMILYNPDKDSYVLSISRGEIGERIPEGLIRFNKTNPLVKLFIQKEYKYIFENRNAIVAEDINKLLWKESVISNGNGIKQLLHSVSEQLPKLNAVACVPAYHQHTLMAILLLGEKHDGSRFDQEELDFFSALASDVAMAIRNAQLFEDLRKEAERNRNLFIQTTIALGSAIEAKDSYTHGHTERVTKYALAIGRQMEASGSYVFPHKFFENL